MYVRKSQMDLAIKNFIAESGDEDDIRTDYSGRGMYGRTCYGVVGSTSAIAIKFMIAVAEAVYPSDDDYFGRRDFIVEMAEEMRTDSMAWDTIFYFPELVIEDDTPDEEDEDATADHD